jgi:hypothetical protein
MGIDSRKRSLDVISESVLHWQSNPSLISSRLRVRASLWEVVQLEAERSSVQEAHAENEAPTIKTDNAAKANDVATKDETKEEANDSAIVKRGSIVYVPFFGPCNQLVNAVTAVWLATLVPGSRVKVLSVKRHFLDRKGTNVTRRELNLTFSKEDVFTDVVLSKGNFVIDRLTHLVRIGQPTTMSLAEFINSKGEDAKIQRQFKLFQELHNLPDDLPVDFFLCDGNESKVRCYQRALQRGRNVLVAEFNECSLRPLSVGKLECEPLYNFMKQGILRNPPLPSGVPQFEASIQLRLTDFRRGFQLHDNFKDVHYQSQTLRYEGNFTTSQLIDALLEVYAGKIYVTFPPTKKLTEYISMKNTGDKRLYTPQDFHADMLLDQTLGASATTFISDSHSTYSVMMDARRPVNSSVVTIDKWITMHSYASWVGTA